MRRSLLFVGFLLAVSFRVLAQGEFAAGLSAYQNGDWKAALEQWESLTFGGKSSGELEYNIGNAYFRLGETASAILHYERALKYLPTDSDVLHNLRLANLGTVDRIDPTLRLGIWDAADGVRDAHNSKQIAEFVVWIGLVTALAVGLHVYSPLRFRKALRRLSYALAAVLIMLCFLYMWRASYEAQARAIVMVEKTDVFSGPSDSSTQLFSLHAGSRIRVHEELSGWIRVSLSDGRDGWMKQSEAERI